MVVLPPKLWYKLILTTTYLLMNPRTDTQSTTEISPVYQPQPLLWALRSQSTLHLLAGSFPRQVVQTIPIHHFLTSQRTQAHADPQPSRPSRPSAPFILSISPSNRVSRTRDHPSTFPKLLLALHLLDLHLLDLVYDLSRSLVGQVPSDRPSLSHPSIHGESVHSTRPSLRSGSIASATLSSGSGAWMSEAASTSSQKMYQGHHLRPRHRFPPLDRRPVHHWISLPLPPARLTPRPLDRFPSAINPQP